MAETHIISGSVIDDAHPLAVEQQGAMPLPTGAATLAEQLTQTIALQLIDNLINALASVATDQLRADIIAELPAGTQNIGDVDILEQFGSDGILTPGTHIDVDVTPASTLIIAANANRRILSIMNASNTRIWLGYAIPAVVGVGDFIDPGGGAFASRQGDGIFTGAVNGIHAGAGNMAVTGHEGT